MHIKIQNQMFIVLPPAKMYDINIFLELYSYDWGGDMALGFESLSSVV